MFNKYTLVEYFNPKRSLKQNYNLVASSPFCSRCSESTSHIVITVTTYLFMIYCEPDRAYAFHTDHCIQYAKNWIRSVQFYPNLKI